MAISVNQPIGANDLIESLYPIGSIFLTINNADYTNFLGKTWERIEADKALWTASSDAGNTIPAGLPNIIGTWKHTGALQGTDGSDAISSDTTLAQNGGFSYGSLLNNDGIGTRWYSFNANNGASVRGIYGNATTVQPPAYKVYAWKRTS